MEPLLLLPSSSHMIAGCPQKVRYSTTTHFRR